MFTVFTATFNRAHTLPRLYKSLLAQTYDNFEWIIVDDGSRDSTDKIIRGWQKEAWFPIYYLWQENKGKHVAFNCGVLEARGMLFLPLDSDDACVSDALERFAYHWYAISFEKRDGFTGVCALCMDQNGKLVGDLFPFNPTDSDSMEIRYRYRVKGEKWGFNRTDVLKRFPFPEHENMKFILEGFVWKGIARFYKTRFVNEILRVYHVQDSKGSDQLSRSLSDIRETISKKYAIGGSLYYEFLLNNDISWLRFKPMEFFIYAINDIRFSLHSRKTLRRVLKGVYTLKGKILVLIAGPIAIPLYLCESKNVFVIHKVIRKVRSMLSKILFSINL